MKHVRTYDCRKVIVTFGTHMVTGYAEDSFVSIEPAGEGISTVVGCDGEIARSMDPDKTANIKLTLLQTSDSNQYFNKIQKLDNATGMGLMPLMITDLRGMTLFHADEAWIVKQAPVNYGKATQNREWEIRTGEADIVEDSYT